jgi:hypothetical protein
MTMAQMIQIVTMTDDDVVVLILLHQILIALHFICMRVLSQAVCIAYISIHTQNQRVHKLCVHKTCTYNIPF